MSEPFWLELPALLALHDESIAEHGGAPGTRDLGLLESALARPLNAHAYNGVEDIAALAAAYAFGIVRNHPFVDGNKRSGFLAAVVFLEINGQRFHASEEDATMTFLALAAGDLEEAALADWLRANSAPRP
jgi:death-on-curing protein